MVRDLVLLRQVVQGGPRVLFNVVNLRQDCKCKRVGCEWCVIVS
jgi:hypothetical protein